MKRVVDICVFIFCLSYSSAVYSQQLTIGPLTIGDTVPNLHLKHIVNTEEKNVSLSDFRAKITIIDFWSSWCSSCIQQIPHLDSLKKEFGRDLNILLFNTKSYITNDNKEKILSVIEKVNRQTGASINLPIVYDSRELDNLFPCKMIPHAVWINESSVVIAITSSIEVNRKNIEKLLNGDPPSMHLKKDDLDYDSNSPLFENGNGGEASPFYYRSIITGYREGIGGNTARLAKDKPGVVIGYSISNASLETLVGTAYFGTGLLDARNRTIVELPDSVKYNPGYNDSMYDHLYCYDITTPGVNANKMREYMREDLQRCFNIHVKREKRKVPSLILTLENFIEHDTIRNDSSGYDTRVSSKEKYFRNTNLKTIVNLLNRRTTLPIPIIYKGDRNPMLDIYLPENTDDISALIRAFKHAGITLKYQEELIEVTVIAEK